MKKLPTHFLLLFISLILIPDMIMASEPGHDPLEVRFVKNNQEQLSYRKQQELSNRPAWQQFVFRYDGWNALFDERNGMPHRAYGSGVMLAGATLLAKAQSFINNELPIFGLQLNDLVFQNEVSTFKYHYIDFFQVYQGLEVLNSRVTVRMTSDGQLVLFGTDVYSDISISSVPFITFADASLFAASGITYSISSIDVKNKLKILPIPVEGKYEYHLVYEVMLKTIDAYNIPGKYYTLVDAQTGVILERTNQVKHLDANLHVSGTVSVNPTVPTVTENIPYLRINVGGTDYFTDVNGDVTIPNINNATNATIYIQGTWSKVLEGTSNNPSSYTVSINSGANNITLGSALTLREVSAYHGVSIIHDFMKGLFQSTLGVNFTGLDEDLDTNVDVAGSCNAFYDGNSVNFYAQGDGCVATALINDVVYHEYGHAINDRYYSDNGENFNNGAMGEGYADVWGMGLTNSPVIGAGFYIGETDGIREYQNDIKVYPDDLVGEVHGDGKIIAGSWWWVRYNIGSMTDMMNIFVESLNGFAQGPDGTEGTVFRDILLDALLADDNNGNINDGTPNDIDILDAFALHGITLIGDITFAHTEPIIAAALQTNDITATVTADYPIYLEDVFIHFKEDNSSIWTDLPMLNTSGSNYSVTIPAYPKGTILDYYFSVTDIYGYDAIQKPSKVLDADPNLAYKLMIGFEELLTDDMEGAINWYPGDPDDDATTGEWTIDDPVPSYLTFGVPTSLCQTGNDHTASGSICAFTGQAGSSDAAGQNDVDGGKRTIYSPIFDLSTYENPAISYYRWFTNDQGANPGNDPWNVYIANDFVTWIPVENTYTADHSWRNNAFRVTDYLAPNSTVQLRFVASDNIITGVYLEGQSLVEGAIDDLIVWEEAEGVGISAIENPLGFSLFPNPATENISVSFNSEGSNDIKVEVLNPLGQLVAHYQFNTLNQFEIPVEKLPAGSYLLKATLGESVWTSTFSVQR